MNSSGRILVVDDEILLRESLGEMLEMDGFSVSMAGNGQEGLDSLLASPFDVAVVDIIMPGTDGMWLMDKIKRADIDVGVIVATGYGSVDLAVKAMKMGAWDFIQKPADYELMKMVVERSMERISLLREKRNAEEKILKQNQQLTEANIKLKELDKLKNSFLSKAVHELRSPLTVMTCSAELIIENLDDKNSADIGIHVENLMRFTRHMSTLVNEMLDINMIVSGNIKMNMNKSNLVAFVKETFLETTSLLEKNGVRQETDFPDISIETNFSPERIKQVMINFIANAVRFTARDGCIKVSVVDGKDEVVVSVADTGCGIPDENLDKVFDEFFQVDQGDKKGTGLGLAICKKIIDSHKGRIWAESALNKGTTFFFALPK